MNAFNDWCRSCLSFCEKGFSVPSRVILTFVFFSEAPLDFIELTDVLKHGARWSAHARFFVRLPCFIKLSVGVCPAADVLYGAPCEQCGSNDTHRSELLPHTL